MTGEVRDEGVRQVEREPHLVAHGHAEVPCFHRHFCQITFEAEKYLFFKFVHLYINPFFHIIGHPDNFYCGLSPLLLDFFIISHHLWVFEDIGIRTHDHRQWFPTQGAF